MIRAKVLGFGNLLLGDDGAGVYVLQYLNARDDLHDVDIIDAGTLGFALASVVDGADALLVLDAAELGAAPGTLRRFEALEMDHFVARPRSSVHEIGLADLLDALRVTGRLPSRRALIGIQPARIDWGTSPGPAVTAALPRAAALAVAQIHRWQREPAPAALDAAASG